MQKLDGLMREVSALKPGALEANLEQAQDFMEMVQLYNSAIREITTKLEILNSTCAMTITPSTISTAA